MSKSRVSLLLSLITVLTTLLTLVGSAPHETFARAAGVSEVLLSWEWELSSYRLASVVGGDGRTYTRVEAEGLVSGGLPGWPNLPRLGKLVALPPSGDFQVVLTEISYETVSLDHPVEPAPAPAPVQFDADGLPQPGEWAFMLDEDAYAGSDPYPAEFATLGDPAWMRDQRLARLTITPFRYHPERQTLDVARRLRLQVVSVGKGLPSIPSADEALGPGSASAALNASDLLNPADLDAFRAARQSILQPSAPERPGEFKVLIETEGIYVLDYTTLSVEGVPLASINPATLRLIHGGTEVAVQWEGDSDGTFESNERLVFYAQPQLTRYAAYDVYWLTWGGGAGQRMGSRSGSPAGLPAGTAWATAVAEENTAYDSLYPGWDGNHWFWRKLRQPDILTDTFTLSLETPATGTTGELAIWLQGYTRDYTDPDHHVEFAWNGTNVGDVEWEGKIAYPATFSLPAGSLNGGDNTLLLTLPDDLGGDVEGVWVDVVTVTYGLSGVGGNVARFQGESTASAYTVGGFTSGDLRVYDVSDPAAPLVVNGWTEGGGAVSVGDSGSTPAEYLILTGDQIQSPAAVFAAKSYADPLGGADYIIITHPEFIASLVPLVAHRAAGGLRVALVDVEALYDYFGDGRMDPQAIRDFLGYAYANWPGAAPLYVLLVGDGTYDPRDYWPGGNLTYVPPYLGDVDPWMGETSSDKWYAEMTGDILPDLRLGRLPVNSPAEVTAVVDKIIAYETTPAPGDWKRRLVFAADNPSTAGNHHADADKEYNVYATPAYGNEGVRVYLSETAGPSYFYTVAAEARDALAGALNEGALLYTYFGHSSWHQEAVLETDGYAPLFHRNDITRTLDNKGRWPVVLHMTCFTGYYIHLTSDTLDESLLRTADVGAVAVWGPSGNGVVADHRVLDEAFYESVFDDGHSELGAATHAALAGLYARGVAYDLIDTYHLFGDPAMMLNKAARYIYMPVVMRGF
jgi:hypothetical protein